MSNDDGVEKVPHYQLSKTFGKTALLSIAYYLMTFNMIGSIKAPVKDHLECIF